MAVILSNLYVLFIVKCLLEDNLQMKPQSTADAYFEFSAQGLMGLFDIFSATTQVDFLGKKASVRAQN